MRLSLNRRGAIVVLAFFLASLALLTFRQYRPPYQLYGELAVKEIDQSMQAIDWNGQKYVKFRQLQGYACSKIR